MSIDATTLDEFDSEAQYQPTDFPPNYWNDHAIILLSDPCIEPENTIFSLEASTQTLSDKLIVQLDQDAEVSAVAQPILQTESAKAPSDWAAAQHLVNHYLKSARFPKETVCHAGNVITARISLSELLSQEYADLANPPIPFTIPDETIDLPTSNLAPPSLPLTILSIPLTVSDLQAQARAQALSTALPSHLLPPPPGVLGRYHPDYYIQMQSEYYTKLQTDCFIKLFLENPPQISPLTPPSELQAIAAAQSLATSLPPELLPPPGFRIYNDYYYAKIQSEYRAKLEAENYAKLLAEQQAQIAAAAPPEVAPTPSSNQQFVSLIEGKLAEAKDPSYTDQFSRPAYNEQFVSLIEGKLAETKDPSYTDQFSRPDYTAQFVELIGSRLGEARDPTIYNEQLYRKQLLEAEQVYMVGIKAIEAFFEGREVSLPSFFSKESTTPLCEIPLLGFPDQRTIHFHCGIANDFASVVEGGICLSSSLGKEFAVQPHLLHSNSIAEGVVLVGTEKIKPHFAKLNAALDEFIPGGANTLKQVLQLPEIILETSQIQQSINYEVANLSTIAQNIIQSGNPNLKQVHVTFSNGGYVFKEALKQLPPEYQQTIVVISLGTTAIIEDHLACEVYNIIGNKDLASQVCNGLLFGIGKENPNASVEIICQGETQPNVGGHYFMQADYQFEISKIINNNIVGKYEVF